MIPVIIPFYKKQEQLDKCVSHLKAQTLPVEIFIHDNSIRNIYFTAAINEGIKKYLHAGCKYMLMINQDMYLRPNAVEEMVKFMDAAPDCGICTPLQLDCKDESMVICGGGLNAFPLGRHECGKIDKFKTNREIFWANGACMMFRREMIEEIGLLDKNMRLICSDSDYCFSARMRGWKIWLVVSAMGTHEHGVSGATQNIEMELIKHEDVIHFIDKWLSGGIYKQLAAEGPQLTNAVIDEVKNKFKQGRSALLNALQKKFIKPQ